jgi:opacity protein-like surface antigen
MSLKYLLAALLFTSAIPAISQVAPAATSGGFPLVVGAGVSDYDVDWGHGRMEGGTLWIDYAPSLRPSFLNGLGIEAEARDISIGHSNTQPANFRQDTAGGGPIYSWRHFRNFRPYAKYLWYFGSFDFRSDDPNYNHDTRVVRAPGGGFDYRVFRHIWVRADYEYQSWPNLFRKVNALNPQGFTLGAVYDFRRARR